MQQCLWWRHGFWDLWISQKHKNLDISRTKNIFTAKKTFVAEVTFNMHFVRLGNHYANMHIYYLLNERLFHQFYSKHRSILKRKIHQHCFYYTNLKWNHSDLLQCFAFSKFTSLTFPCSGPLLKSFLKTMFLMIHRSPIVRRSSVITMFVVFLSKKKIIPFAW